MTSNPSESLDLPVDDTELDPEGAAADYRRAFETPVSSPTGPPW